MNEEIDKLIEEFDAKLKAMKEEYNQDWNAEYFFIASTGDIYSNHWVQDESDTKSYEIGNVFKTKEEALFEVEKRKVLHELRMMGKPFVRGKFNLVIYMEDENIIISRAILNTLYGNYYFRTKDEAENAIKKIGEDRIKKYLFGIDEE